MNSLNPIYNWKNDSLYKLIRSMSKGEKKHFRMMNSGGGEKAKFMVLFDAIDRSGEMGVVRDVHLKGIKAAQLGNLKLHLHQKILQLLRHLRSSKLPESEVNDLIEDARILYERCLYAECVRTLVKAKEIALKHHMQIQLLGIYELEKRAMMYTSLPSGGKHSVQRIIEEINTHLQKIDHANSFSNLLLTINQLYRKYGFIRSEHEREEVMDQFREQLPRYTESELSFEEKMYLYYALSAYNFFIREIEEGHRYSHALVLLFETHPEMKYSKTEFYIRALNQLLVAQNKLMLTDEFLATHRKLVSIKRDKKFKLSRNLNLHLFKAIYLHEINKHFMLSEFRKGTRVVNKLTPDLNKFIPLLDQNTVYLFYYKIACLYLGAEQFKTALTWLNRIIRESETTVREDLQSFARILRLICYFEQDDDDAVQSNIKSTYRFLLRKKHFNKYEALIIQFLKGLRGNESEAELKKAFLKLKREMIVLAEDHYEQRSFLYFDIISWLESKIEDRSVQEVMQDKLLISVVHV